MAQFDHFTHLLARISRTLFILSAIVMTSWLTPVQAQQVTMETLLDRIQIEDFITRYYFDLSRGESHALSDYFTEDAILDVDGTIAQGHAEIAALYQPVEGEETAQSIEPRGRAHMLLNNPIIEVSGNTATAHFVWTGVLNPGVGKAPGLYEQGREYTELVKQDGKWLISHRFISSDSGLPDRFDETYEPREHP